jgi:hypothetical protein
VGASPSRKARKRKATERFMEVGTPAAPPPVRSRPRINP